MSSVIFMNNHKGTVLNRRTVPLSVERFVFTVYLFVNNRFVKTKTKEDLYEEEATS